MLTRRKSLAQLAAGFSFGAPVLALAQTRAGATDGRTVPSDDVRAFGAKGNRRDFDDNAFSSAIANALQNDQYPSSIHISPGHYRRARSIALPNHVALRGEGPSSVLNSQNDAAFAAPILVNQSSTGAVGWRLSDFSLFGGSHGLKLDVSAEIANLRFDDVGILMQSVANIEANKLFQTSKFFGGVLGSAPYGLKVDQPTTNAFNSFGMEWTDHSKCSLYLRGAGVVLVVGGRFEGSGAAGNATIDIEDGVSITFIGVYFENVHEYLARLRRTEIVSFVNCHFTGTHAGSPDRFVPFKWDIDANLLIFRDCHSTVPMPVPGNVVLDGCNVNIYPTHAVYELHGLCGRVCAAPRHLGKAGAVDLLMAARRADDTSTDTELYHCDLTLTIAETGDTPGMTHWQGAFAITAESAVTQISLASKAVVTLGRVTLALAVAPGARLIARYQVDGGGGNDLPQLSWNLEWRRVAGGPISSLLIQVP